MFRSLARLEPRGRRLSRGRCGLASRGHCLKLGWRANGLVRLAGRASILRKRRLGACDQSLRVALARMRRRAHCCAHRLYIRVDFGIGTRGVGGRGRDALACPLDERCRRGILEVAAQPLVLLNPLDHPLLAFVFTHDDLNTQHSTLRYHPLLAFVFTHHDHILKR
jgi:hypothetical protein